ncbi:MAG TPA: sulfurtransferase [Candidatus Limnocylindrales bacterium]|nr:sulfurtransferase [Candidatus Limnocylindrales bacterium]
MTRASPILSAPELAGRLAGGDRVRLVDCRWVLGVPGAGRARYDEGHLPGAVHVDLDDALTDPAGLGAPGRHPLPSPTAFAAAMRAIGVRDGDLVVAYDDVGGWVAARLWWMLENLGHPEVAVLDGGIQAWLAAGGSLTTAEPPVVPAGPDELHLGGAWTGVILRDELKRRLGDVVLLDARAAERYRGETEPIDPVAGHIPTARSAPIDGNLAEPAGAFLPAPALAARFAALAADGSDGPVVTSCGSGVSALHHSLAMRIAGLPDPILYVGSYSDWSRSGEPVATGAEPGDLAPE